MKTKRKKTAPTQSPHAVVPPPPSDERGGLPSASGIERMMMCPGSMAAEKDRPQLAENEAASEGSLIHAAVETGNVTGLDDEQIQVMRRLQQIEADALAAWLLSLGAASAKPKAHREERLWLRTQDGLLKPLASSKLDVFYLEDGSCLLIDMKTGYLNTPPAATNWQLRTQALCVREEYPEVTKIRVAIAQHRFHSKYDDCDYTEADLEDAREEIRHGLWRAEQPDAARVPGAWCRYCKAKNDCPEAAAFSLLPLACAGSPAVPMVGEALRAELAGRVSTLNPMTLGFLQDRRAIALGIFDAVEARLKSMNGTELAAIGYAMQENSPLREVVDLKQALDLLVQHGLMTPAQFQDCCKVTLGKIEALIKKDVKEKLNLQNLDQACAHIGMVLAPTIRLNPRKPSLVRRRAPVVPGKEPT